MNVEETHADYTLSYGKAKTPAPSVGQPLKQALKLKMQKLDVAALRRAYEQE